MQMQLKDKPRVKRQNYISISAYGWENARINKDGEEELGYATTLRVAKEIKSRHVNLLMIGDKVNTFPDLLVLSTQELKSRMPTVTSTSMVYMVKLSLNSAHILKTLNDDGISTKKDNLP